MGKYTITVLLLLVMFSELSYADVLIINRINQTQTFDMPKRGMTMSQVINQFGEPKLKKPAVGEPPITEWQFDKFSVYFERQWVINSVVYKATPEEKGPKYISNQP